MENERKQIIWKFGTWSSWKLPKGPTRDTIPILGCIFSFLILTGGLLEDNKEKHSIVEVYINSLELEQ